MQPKKSKIYLSQSLAHDNLSRLLLLMPPTNPDSLQCYFLSARSFSGAQPSAWFSSSLGDSDVQPGLRNPAPCQATTSLYVKKVGCMSRLGFGCWTPNLHGHRCPCTCGLHEELATSISALKSMIGKFPQATGK